MICAWVPSPLLRKPYGAWLATTPWRHGQPAPLGPIWPTWADGLLLGLVGVVGISEGLPWWLLPTATAATWSLVVLVACSGHGTAVTWVAFGLPFTCYPWVGLWQVPVVILALAGAVAWGYRQRLRAFPFHEDEPDAIRASAPPKSLGMPFSTLSPLSRTAENLWAKTLAVALLVWYLHSLTSTMIRLTGHASEVNPVSYTHLTLPTIYSV